jgi:hypothetical protein
MAAACPLVEPPYPADLLRHARELLASILAGLGGPARYRRAVEAVQARYPEHAEQARPLARVLGVDPRELLLANLSYDLMMGLFGCSTMVLATPDGPLLARNMDWPMSAQIARASCLTRTAHGLNAGFIGAVGVVSGLSSRGFAVVLNAVGGPLDLDGYPVLLFLRHLLDDAESFDQAVAWASETPLATSGLITLAGTENAQRVCVERTAHSHRQRWADGDRPLLVTNHYRRLAAPSACARYANLASFTSRLPVRPDDEELLALLTHPGVRQTITAQHVIACPADASIRLYVPDDLDDRADDFSNLRDLF